MRRALVPLLAGLAALAAGCGPFGEDRSGELDDAARDAGLGDPQVVARGVDVPWGLAFLPGGAPLVAERETGRILRLSAEGGAPREVARVPGVDAEAGEGGLLGLAVSPAYARDRLVYAYHSAAEDNRVVRFRLGDDEVEPVITGIVKGPRHNGGRIAFGPDGKLYVGTGDASEPELSQQPDSLNGKVLRVEPDGSVPRDNPSASSPVFSLGHRNVQGLAWDRDGRLWADEFGEDERDELNLVRPGRNYGWPEVEGEGDTRGGRWTNPAVTWPVPDASPSGAAIRGSTLYVAALRGERLWRVPLDGERAGEPEALLLRSYGRLRTVAVAPDGALWVTTSNRDGYSTPEEGDDRVLRIPVT